MTTVATTFDGAVMTVDASGGVPSTAVYQGGIALRQDGAMYTIPVGGNAYDPRTLFLGDSHIALGYSTVVPTGFTVSNGIATLDFSGNHNVLPGNRFSLTAFPTGTTTMASNALAYIMPTALTATTSPQRVTFSATVNGVTAPNGDYMTDNLAGGGTALNWLVLTPNAGKDSSIVHNLNSVSGMALQPTWMFARSSTTSEQHINGLTRLQSVAPKSTYSNVFISVGTNNSTGGPGGMLSQATLTTAIASAEYEYNNIMTIADALYSNGTVFILIPIGGTSYANAVNFTRGMAYLRHKLLNTRRPYRMKFIDVFGLSMDGTSSTGATLTNYWANTNHMSTYGGHKIGQIIGSQLRRYTVDQWPNSNEWLGTYLDDNTNVPPAWSPTTYTAGKVVLSGHNCYLALTGGTATVAPTGTSNVTDGTLTWKYVGPAALNLCQNGGMNGTTGTITATNVVGTLPTGYTCSNTGTANVSSATLAGDATVFNPDTGSEAIPGKGLNVDATFSAAGTLRIGIACTGLLTLGTWYQFRFTVSGRTADNTVLKSVAGELIPSGGYGVNFPALAMSAGGNVTTIPLKVGEWYEVISAPFYVPTGIAQGTGLTFNFDIASSAGGVAISLQLSKLYISPVRDPTLIPAAA